MQTFTDNKGQLWTIEITYDSLRRIEADTRMDLTMPLRGVASGESVITLLNQSILVLLKVLWSVCRIRAEELRVKREWFEKNIEGEPLEEARQKLMQELADFFRRNRREGDADFVDEMDEMQRKIQTITKSNLNINEPSSISATNTPELSESIPVI
jgi:hypothetical protein